MLETSGYKKTMYSNYNSKLNETQIKEIREIFGEYDDNYLRISDEPDTQEVIKAEKEMRALLGTKRVEMVSEEDITPTLPPAPLKTAIRTARDVVTEIKRGEFERKPKAQEPVIKTTEQINAELQRSEKQTVYIPPKIEWRRPVIKGDPQMQFAFSG